MERIVIINESTFVKWTKSVERLKKLLESQEQQVMNRKATEWIDTDEVCRMLGIGRLTGGPPVSSPSVSTVVPLTAERALHID